MALLETWRKLAYETEMNQNQATQFWGNYFNLEKGIYEQILSTPDEPVSGTVKELAEKFNVEVLIMTGFLDGINDSLKNPNPIETMEEDTEVSLDYDKEKLQERVAKLAGGVAVIKVGAATEVEMKEKKDRVDDALHATRAAVEEGIVAGGGTSYIDVIPTVAALLETTEGDEKTGANVILKALEAPLFHISANAGLEGSVIINKVRESEVGVGFDAFHEEYVNMVEKGILDPTKVTRSALQNATSVAGTLLTTEAVVSTIKEETPAMPAGNPGMGMM